MNTIWNFFLDKSKFTYLLIFFLILAGLAAAFTMPREANPEVNVPVGLVTAVYPGASAEDVERLVTDELEEKITNLDDLDTYVSNSREGLAVVTVNFLPSSDIDDRIRALKDAVDEAAPSLPSEVEDPAVTQISFDDVPIAVFSLTADVPEAELKSIAEDFQSELETIQGVSEVSIAGARDQEVQVNVDKRRLDQFGISINEVVAAIQSANISFPVGSIETDEIRYAVSLDAEVEDPDLIGQIPIRSVEGVPIYVRDVADVNFSLAKQSTISRLSVNGEPSQEAVSLSIFKKTGGDITKIVDEAITKVNQLQEEKYEEVGYFMSVDNAKEIKKSLGNLIQNGISTIIIVGVLLFLFLGWREAALASLSIPLTFLFGFICMALLGATVNFLSLFALILALGIVVDTGIVITEGLHAYLKQGYEPAEAARATIKEFQWPLIAGTLTTVSAFVPMLFMGGIMGEFVKHIPITVNFVLVGSLFVALGLMPVVGIRFLKKTGEEKKEALSDEEKVSKYLLGLQRWYKEKLIGLLNSSRQRSLLTMALVIAFIVSIALPVTGILQVVMFPTNDADFFFVDIEAPVGTTLEVTDTVVRTVEEELYDDPRIESFFVNVGTGNSQADFVGGGTTTHLASFTVNLYEERDEQTDSIIQEYRKKLAPITDADINVTQLDSGPPTGAPVLITFKGEDIAELERLAITAQEMLEEINGTTEIGSSIQESALEFELKVNREIASQYGISPLQVAQTLRTAVTGTEASTMRFDGDDIDIDVTLQLNPLASSSNDRTVATITDIEQMVFTTPDGREVPMSTLVDTTIKPGNPSIRHEDGDRISTATAYVEGVTPAQVFAEFEPRIEELAMESGYTIKLGGEAEDVEESFRDLFRALFIGLFLIAAILLLQFDSYRQPFFILLALPMALIGVLPGLALIRVPFSFPAFIGIVALSGVVVNDAIILIDKINSNRRNGMSKYDAILDAGVSRLQPIILTTLTTVAGILPLSLSDPIWAGLGFSVIFGLMFATVLTLIVVPMMYLRFGEEEIA